MGFRYIQHNDMCGCERCAHAWECESPYVVWDKIPDPNYREDGTHIDEPPLDFDDYYED